MRREWEGSYLAGRIAVRQRAVIRLGSTGLEVAVEDGTVLRWPYTEVRQTQGFYPGEHVRLERSHGGSAALVVTETAFLEALQAAAGPARRRFHDPASRRWRSVAAGLAAVGVVGLVLLLYFRLIPAVGTAVAPYVPVSWEERLGASVMEVLAPRWTRCEDTRRTTAVEAIAALLTASVPDFPYRVRVVVVNDPRVNALAVPGGHVVVFRGLLERTRSAEELAGVLAHEIQHVAQRHVVRQIVQQASVGIMLGLLTGEASGVITLQAARTLGELRYSREAEREADAEGVRMLAAAGIDPVGMRTFFEGLEKEGEGLPDYLSTHPSHDERIARVTALAAEARGPRAALLPGVDWADVRRLCERRADSGSGGAASKSPPSLQGHGRLYFVPIGDVPPGRLQNLTTYYADRFGLRVEPLAGIAIPPHAVDPARRQLVAEDVVAVMRLQHRALEREPDTILIGITGQDMYIREFHWQFAFAFRTEGRFAVVSWARMDPANFGLPSDPRLTDERLRKMISKQIGHLYYRLPQSDDRSSVMAGPIGGLDDLDLLAEDF
jgi:Zn-dependent protease with chaperone function/predicted Zn-dependent protease